MRSGHFVKGGLVSRLFGNPNYRVIDTRTGYEYNNVSGSWSEANEVICRYHADNPHVAILHPDGTYESPHANGNVAAYHSTWG